jgi:hypothetical protein
VCVDILHGECYITLYIVFGILYLWFNFDKTHCMYFVAKKNIPANSNAGYNNNSVTNSSCTKFLGLSWDKHIETLVRKLSTACYLNRSTKTYMSTSSLKIIYYASFHSLTCGIIFWGNSPHSIKTFLQQTLKVTALQLICIPHRQTYLLFKRQPIILG